MRTRIRVWIVCGSIASAGVASAQPQEAVPDAPTAPTVPTAQAAPTAPTAPTAPAAPVAPAAPAAQAATEAPPAPSTFTVRRKLALAAGVVGVAAVGVGIGRGLQAASREDDAYELCASPITSCPDAAAANHLLERAESRALQANIAFGVAGVATLAAAILWFTGAPERRVAVSPRVGAVTGLELAVRF